ncbi:CobQ/CobB/MinD/ParA nucleotide-binding domain protein (macronuclear) [Tetrahymena thermophila SB210]|uniref:CobQ/CobB/MinD/ParA nucleotide-binding domain protein n=1 Tax=Tetrahymena thermophila (strain SB210) TaxID=312017 RepID=I7M713_TETTS|nr:CobQ/CobB/MinD/ParA nucleotide-binding domain protein [Tetrahymena thermophila SB210]EAR87658.1 CobQ/CobB/MinD/ParA nucleotide-binding domain protein [Tetrahymena thermophila SB210]|eukprot:XP_001007903.1 CobQ/CobB/MinD/ParA nucleotide-binding domain protein [Tetrahymena thermophila SB210]
MIRNTVQLFKQCARSATILKKLNLNSQSFSNTIKIGQLTQKPTFHFSNAVQEGKAEITKKLKEITFEDGSNIIDNGSILTIDIESSGKVTVQLKLDQNYRKLKGLCNAKLQEIPWIKEFEIKMAPKDQETSFKKRGQLENVKKIIAVSSCKGGVGKSTVAINLAFSLLKQGHKVGIFDADIYGPSIPTLINKENAILQAPEDRPKEILPIEYEGLKTMSYGFARKKAIIRGPMVSAIVTQLAMQTQWGDLDYLIVDMPPGTGDIQITLCQEIKFDGAVVVTTPQKLAFVDVIKGIEMFDELKVPTLAVVENMCLFVCDGCGKEHHPFGPGYMNMLKNQFGIQSSVQIPIYDMIAKYSDYGRPVSITLPDEHTITKIYSSLAENVHQEILKLQNGNNEPPIVRYQTGNSLVIVEKNNGEIKKMKADVLRKHCNCALCVDEFTGKRLIKDDTIDNEVYPYKIEPKGNYAVAIIWSDGHRSSIYPYDTLFSDKIPAYEEPEKKKSACSTSK